MSMVGTPNAASKGAQLYLMIKGFLLEDFVSFAFKEIDQQEAFLTTFRSFDMTPHRSRIRVLLV